jgi:5'-methylthioadenosine phosphorylase
MVTDYDCWHEDHGAVDVAEVIATLKANSGHAKALVAALPTILGPDRAPCPYGCDRALDHAIMTARDARDPELLARLDAVAGRLLT